MLYCIYDNKFYYKFKFKFSLGGDVMEYTRQIKNQYLIHFKYVYKFLILFSLSFLISNFVILSYWRKYISVFHTSFEIICIFISLSSFFIFWFTYSDNKSIKISLLALALFPIAIFNMIHTLMFPTLNLYPAGASDLAAKFWIIGRLCEAFVLLLISSDIKKHINNKWILLFVTFFITIGISILIFVFRNILPKLNTSTNGPTKAKVFFELIIILLYIITYVRLKYNNYHQGIMDTTYKFITTSLVYAISSELCFTLHSDFYSVLFIWGHLLKIIFYCYLFYGIFIRTVIYPYNKIQSLYIESEERFKSAFDNLTMGVIITNLDGKFIKVNKNVLNILGYTEEELLKSTFNDIIPTEDIQFNENSLVALLGKDSNKILLFERRYKHKSGQDIWLKVNISLVNDIMGKPIYYITEIQDISSNKKVIELETGMEKKIKELSDTLTLDKLRTEFFANLSHELRTPLNVISGAIQLLELNFKNSPNESVIRNIEYMKQNTRRLLRLINNLIDTTKIDAGFYQLSLRNYNIVSLIEDITLSISEYASLKGLDIIFDTDIEEKIILCDPDKIERIMLNLLSNAIKFTDRGGIIYVDLKNSIDSVIISVKDTGIGIAKDMQELIFERFRQIDKSFTKNSEGSGIGLSLVKSLIELHGGNIKLKSQVGKGSEFLITLPYHVSNDDTVDIPTGNYLDRVERVQVEFSDIYLND
jgi:PAS domain S-box-containing protein